MIKYSAMTAMQFDPRSPAYADLDIRVNELEDETEWLKLGQTEKLDYKQLEMTQQLPSSWFDDLVEKPNGQYKYASFSL